MHDRVAAEHAASVDLQVLVGDRAEAFGAQIRRHRGESAAETQADRRRIRHHPLMLRAQQFTAAAAGRCTVRQPGASRRLAKGPGHPRPVTVRARADADLGADPPVAHVVPAWRGPLDRRSTSRVAMKPVTGLPEASTGRRSEPLHAVKHVVDGPLALRPGAAPTARAASSTPTTVSGHHHDGAVRRAPSPCRGWRPGLRAVRLPRCQAMSSPLTHVEAPWSAPRSSTADRQDGRGPRRRSRRLEDVSAWMIGVARRHRFARLRARPTSTSGVADSAGSAQGAT